MKTLLRSRLKKVISECKRKLMSAQASKCSIDVDTEHTSDRIGSVSPFWIRHIKEKLDLINGVLTVTAGKIWKSFRVAYSSRKYWLVRNRL